MSWINMLILFFLSFFSGNLDNKVIIYENDCLYNVTLRIESLLISNDTFRDYEERKNEISFVLRLTFDKSGAINTCEVLHKENICRKEEKKILKLIKKENFDCLFSKIKDSKEDFMDISEIPTYIPFNSGIISRIKSTEQGE